MKSKLQLRSGIALLLVVVSTAYAINYQYFSEEETTVFGDRIKFWHEDTLAGVIRSNDTIAIMENPVFYDLVITSAEDFWRGAGYNPPFRGPVPYYEAPPISLPDTLHWYRGRAEEQGMYFTRGANMQAWVQLIDHAFRMSWTPLGVPFDTTVWDTVALPDSAIVFFEGYLRISGRVHTTLIVCAGGSVGLEDNILYASTTHPDGIVTPGHAEKFALIAEGEMKILNTVANGRENSNGLGHGQTNREFKDIALNGIYVVLHESFTFENQNDPDSGYVCECAPDERGEIHVYGGIVQYRRGYVHRTTQSGTGYRLKLRFDNRLHGWADYVSGFNNFDNPDTIDFGDVLVDSTVWDTTEIVVASPSSLGGVFASYPFSAVRQPPFYGRAFTVPISFRPTAPAQYSGVLSVSTEWEFVTVVLRGRGVDSLASPTPPSLTVFPNPFNATAEIRINLTGEESVRVIVYDLLGRVAADYGEIKLGAGEGVQAINGQNWPSGLYWVHAGGMHTNLVKKVLLLK